MQADHDDVKQEDGNAAENVKLEASEEAADEAPENVTEAGEGDGDAAPAAASLVPTSTQRHMQSTHALQCTSVRLQPHTPI